jgi:hypothetical protein
MYRSAISSEFVRYKSLAFHACQMPAKGNLVV